MNRVPNLPFDVKPNLSQELVGKPDFMDRCRLEITVDNIFEVSYTFLPAVLQEASLIVSDMSDSCEILYKQEAYLQSVIQSCK